jgi:hypothetical protein
LTMQAELELFNQKAVFLRASLTSNPCFRHLGVTKLPQRETVCYHG